MLNILSLMVLLSAPADAHHKAHKAPPPKHKHHATAHRHTPPPRHRHHAHRVVGWNWIPGHYDTYGHWNRGRWSFGVKVII